MSKENKIFVSCEDANHFCDKNQYKEASFWEKVRLNIHLIYCKACRKYSKNNNTLTRLINDPKVIRMDAAIKTDMKKQLKEKMSEQQ
ncbi:hypothetical protein GCM10022393_12530 [Aquimarina addita]|uniref:Glycine dehydrogenase n=1 Tax=Aquimarina addita TaxID=870485 RepID=A0ABP7XEE9_9FLAO